MQRIFSAKELELFQATTLIDFFSGRFAAKEAVLKCVGTRMKVGISLTNTQVLQNKPGKPVIQIEGEVKVLPGQWGVVSWRISISHTTCSSTAFVIAKDQGGP